MTTGDNLLILRKPLSARCIRGTVRDSASQRKRPTLADMMTALYLRASGASDPEPLQNEKQESYER